jgi:hypothetical protein
MAPIIVDQVPIARSRRASSLPSPAKAAKDAIWPPIVSPNVTFDFLGYCFRGYNLIISSTPQGLGIVALIEPAPATGMMRDSSSVRLIWSERPVPSCGG